MMVESKSKMEIETQVAAQFIISFLTDKVTDIEVEKYSKYLLKLLAEKFKNHWYPDKPAKGSAYRCVSIEKQIDVVLTKAAQGASIDEELLESLLPDRLDLWIDPSEVSYRIGEHGTVCVIYKEGDDLVNSTSKYLADVLSKLPTVTSKPVSPSPPPQSTTATTDAATNMQPRLPTPIAPHHKPENRLSPTARSFVTQRNAANLYNNLAANRSQAAIVSQVQQLANLEYLRKVYWPLFAASGYDPIATQAAQNYLIVQELAKYQQQVALQSHYMKMQQHANAKNFPHGYATPSPISATSSPGRPPVGGSGGAAAQPRGTGGILKVVT